jgi:hypothetical protein
MAFAARFSARGALILTLCWVGLLAVTGSTDALLFLAPALLISVPLLGGRYVGEELIARCVERVARLARRSRPATERAPASIATWLPRGALLLARSLATRPPPALPVPQT